MSTWGFAWIGGKIKRGKLLILLITIVLMVCNLSIVFTFLNNSFRVKALRLETELPELLINDFNKNCLLILGEEKIFSLDDSLNTIRLDNFLENSEKFLEKSDCVVFLEDWFCLRKDGGSKRKLCEEIKTTFDVLSTKKYFLEEIQYNLYKIK